MQPKRTIASLDYPDGRSTKVGFNFTLTPSDKSIQVAAPYDAKSLAEVHGQRSIGSGITGLLTSTAGCITASL